MKILISAFCAIIFGVVLIAAGPAARSKHLLGTKECTWGPSFWCSNITNAKGCNAVRHCIQTVWEKKTVPEDNDSICQICLDMVKQARDQLESNETQSDLKSVFEGSCKLIPLKPIQKECIKLADDFIPELIETLASQMNPQVVCSVAGLCNNADIDRMLAEMPVTTRLTHDEIDSAVQNNKGLSCNQCNKIGNIISEKFQSANRDDILENLLHVCGELSSYSDGCSNIVLTYFNDIYDELKKSLDADGICHISGVCSAKYHQHPEIVEIRPKSESGVVKDDIPCELCEQLVNHLRDLLVANTTESEFKQVLEGLCKQTKGFKDECLSIVDQYYGMIYETLVHDLDANGACFMIGVCPKGLKFKLNNGPIMPLLPAFKKANLAVSVKEKTKLVLGENEPKLTNEEIMSAQLPFDKLMGAPRPWDLEKGGEYCAICEYFLHFIQEALATPKTAEEIKQIVKTTCNKLPNSVNTECQQFVENYGDMVIALLIQNIDPRTICPELKLCPANHKDMEVFSPKPIKVSIIGSNPEVSSKPTCPLCLFAVAQAKAMITDNVTEQNVQNVLNKLCMNDIPKKLKEECVDFVNTYSKELIEKLVNDFTPQQICIDIHLCPPEAPNLSELNISFENNDDILTNEIADNTINGNPIENYNYEVTSPECLLCKEIIKEAEKRIINKKSKAEIKEALEHACEKIHQIKNKCKSYMTKYGDKIVNLIMSEIAPKEICSDLLLCESNDNEDLEFDDALKIDIIAIPSQGEGIVKLEKMKEENVGDSPQCVLCEFIMVKLEQQLKDKKTEEEIKNEIRQICSKMPKTISVKCNNFVSEYGDAILNLLETIPPKEVCQYMMVCESLNIAHDEVVECGVCHGAVITLTPMIKANPELDIHTVIEDSCNDLPAKYNGKCTDLIAYYGPSIQNLIKKNTPQSEICAKIGKCFPEEQSVRSYLRIGGTIDSQSQNTNRNRRSADENKKEVVGENQCTWGPTHWCSDPNVATTCKTVQYCQDRKLGYYAS